MIHFFKTTGNQLYALESRTQLASDSIFKLEWLFGNAQMLGQSALSGRHIGPRREMITPWSTNAVEITQNMGITGILRIEVFIPYSGKLHDPMLEEVYEGLDQYIFTVDRKSEPVYYIDDIDAYNKSEGLALSSDEIRYLEDLSHKLERRLTDCEIFGFSQVNSEHCRHKIFNGTFIVDGIKKDYSLFELIRHTTQYNTNRVISAYQDNCAFLRGPEIQLFTTRSCNKPGYFEFRPLSAAISLKAETHNFPTTVEPFNGAATGTGGEIRDRVAGGKGAFPLAGTAVYMTSYPRLNGGRRWEQLTAERRWLYHKPAEILIRASNGTSDFGNKFGQPLICGSLFTFEHSEHNRIWAFDKVIMLAGGVGYTSMEYSTKDEPAKGNIIVLLGGDNYRIGMGGGAVSSVATGEYGNVIELNAVQRSNPEMQKRICNVIRLLAESAKNPIISIHDHGAGGHLNCLSELVENTGGHIDMDKLPIGDPTLSAKEIIGNESQERIGLIISQDDAIWVREICERERAPFYIIGEVTGDMQFVFQDKDANCPINLRLEDLFGNPPGTVIRDDTDKLKFREPGYSPTKIHDYIEHVLQLEAVACKDWLTNKVDRSVTGLVAKQQTCGKLQLPLNNLGVVALDYVSHSGIATAIGHAPAAAMVDPAKGSILAIAEALTNIMWGPVQDGIRGISLSANWIWPGRNPGEDARLYAAVSAASDFAIALGINIPTGKDSLSMTQKYPDGSEVYAPGTVIISAAGEVTDIRNVVEPVIQMSEDSELMYVDLSLCGFEMGGSAFYQSMNCIGSTAPTVLNPGYFADSFDTIQELILNHDIVAGHDISTGGMIVTLLEMCFSQPGSGMKLNLDPVAENDLVKILFSEKPGIVIQVRNNTNTREILQKNGIVFYRIGSVSNSGKIEINKQKQKISLIVDNFRKHWFKTSYELDKEQSGTLHAEKRFRNFARHPLEFNFCHTFSGKFAQYTINPVRRTSTGIKSAIIREKGVNGDREMAYVMHLAGFDVKDVHMTDLISGRETLDDVNLIVFVGGFSNSDVLGSAKGWAGAFLYNERAKIALDRYYARNDTLSLGVCNGCQLMAELDLIMPEHEKKPGMHHNHSHKFESAFLSVDIPENHSVMLNSLSGSRLGIWIAHGEGRYSLPYDARHYHIVMKYSHTDYPFNPNGSDYDAAALCSSDGRHLAMMPHIERSAFPWNWAYYPGNRSADEISPWIEAFINAKNWIRDLNTGKSDVNGNVV
ncbi:MAG: phosphoribosylformylglycinamidine synthase [Bacteroidales bacterium]|nr:phosphoribosylformylglycinamidine synthase [Bacteroidales bacterium]